MRSLKVPTGGLDDRRTTPGPDSEDRVLSRRCPGETETPQVCRTPQQTPVVGGRAFTGPVGLSFFLVVDDYRPVSNPCPRRSHRTCLRGEPVRRLETPAPLPLGGLQPGFDTLRYRVVNGQCPETPTVVRLRGPQDASHSEPLTSRRRAPTTAPRIPVCPSSLWRRGDEPRSSSTPHPSQRKSRLPSELYDGACPDPGTSDPSGSRRRLPCPHLIHHVSTTPGTAETRNRW